MPGADRDDESGKYQEKYPTEEFLEAISQGGVGTQDVADSVGCSYETAYKKLRNLEETGLIDSRKVANTRIWGLRETEEGQKRDSTDWQRKRREVLKRDEFTCQECGRAAEEIQLEVHHKQPVSQGGSDEPENLMSLCVDCHAKRHKKASDEELLEAVEENYPAATSEVAEDVGIVRQSADYRLRKLREAARVRSKKIGASLVWFREERAREPPERGAEAAGEGGGAPEPQDSADDDGSPAEVLDVDDDVAALVEELDLPGAGAKLEKRRAAIGEILTVMRHSGAVNREEILAIAEKHDYGGYASGSSFRSNVWANHALPQLKECGAVRATDTSGVYEFGEV